MTREEVGEVQAKDLDLTRTPCWMRGSGRGDRRGCMQWGEERRSEPSGGRDPDEGKRLVRSEGEEGRRRGRGEAQLRLC